MKDWDNLCDKFNIYNLSQDEIYFEMDNVGNINMGFGDLKVKDDIYIWGEYSYDRGLELHLYKDSNEISEIVEWKEIEIFQNIIQDCMNNVESIWDLDLEDFGIWIEDNKLEVMMEWGCIERSRGDYLTPPDYECPQENVELDLITGEVKIFNDEYCSLFGYDNIRIDIKEFRNIVCKFISKYIDELE